MRRISRLLALTPFVACVDLVLINLGLLLAFVLNGCRIGPTPTFVAYIHAIPWICSFSLVILYLCNLYTDWLCRKGQQLVFSVWVATLLISLATMAISFWDTPPSFPRSVIVDGAIVQFTLLGMYRLLLRRVHSSTVGRSRVMVIAPDENQAISLIRKLESSAPVWMEFVGYLVSNGLDDLEQKASHFDTIMLTARLPEQRELIKRCARMEKNVMVVPAVMEMSLLCAHPMVIDDVLILAVQTPRLTLEQRLFKRVFDLAVSMAMLLLTSPILLSTWILVRLTSRGSAIFKQDRVGQDGVEFTLFKFRTMVPDAEKHCGPVLARESDPRITKLGCILRVTRIDELPQLFNVLMGDMSMVGPRPERKFFVSKFLETVPGYDFRFTVKPGITGLGQVDGSYSTAVERKLRFDLLYIYDYSLMLDFRILLRTVLVVLHRDRAAGLQVTPFTVVKSDFRAASDSLGLGTEVGKSRQPSCATSIGF